MLVFDGTCGFCTACVQALKKLDRRDRIAASPAQRAGIVAAHGLNYADTRGAVWAFPVSTHSERASRHKNIATAAGEEYSEHPPPLTPPVSGVSGAAAVNLALDTALGVHIFTPIYKVPLVRFLQERIYAWIAAHRHLLPGTTPWCKQYPDDCGTESDVDGENCGCNS